MTNPLNVPFSPAYVDVTVHMIWNDFAVIKAPGREDLLIDLRTGDVQDVRSGIYLDEYYNLRTGKPANKRSPP